MQDKPDVIARDVIDLCANCDFCRNFLAKSPCMFFPRLYHLHDAQAAGKPAASPRDLKTLMSLCNMCGSCPCPSIRTKIRQSRDGFVAEEGGLRPGLRLLNDVRLLGRLGALFPRLANWLTQTAPWAGLLKRVVGIHPDRAMPPFPGQTFDAWAQQRGLTARRPATGRKVAYFVGCSATYMFPEVAKATVEVLERNGVSVYVPEQRCCGMPAMMEGDRDSAYANVRFNMARLLECIDDGYDLIFSCPTCCYMHKSVLRDGAQFSPHYRAYLREQLAEDDDVRRLASTIERDLPGKRACGLRRSVPQMALHMVLKGLYKDEGYFADLDGVERMRIADHAYDLAEYLRYLRDAGEFDTRLGPLPERMAYYAPCHLKEQDIGRPWLDILSAVPGIQLPEIGDLLDCCGSSGVRGFQQKFHKMSLVQGRPLFEKMRAANPERIATDCLSCRLQFNQALPNPVSHPVEILRAAYRSHDDEEPS